MEAVLWRGVRGGYVDVGKPCGQQVLGELPGEGGGFSHLFLEPTASSTLKNYFSPPHFPKPPPVAAKLATIRVAGSSLFLLLILHSSTNAYLKVALAGWHYHLTQGDTIPDPSRHRIRERIESYQNEYVSINRYSGTRESKRTVSMEVKRRQYTGRRGRKEGRERKERTEKEDTNKKNRKEE